jgi:sugar O-acyltransferase (sialic acid O-acetyltransferase NeuD family)
VKKIVIYGNGAMAKVLYSYLRKNYEVTGFVVDEGCIAKDKVNFLGLPLVSFNSVCDIFSPESYQMIISVGYPEMNEVRQKKCEQATQLGYELASYIHKSFHLHDDVRIGQNCIILEHVFIHPGARIGDGTFICANVNIGHDCCIGNYNWINSGVTFGGRCRTGVGCFFGNNSCIGHGVSLGERNFIAAHTLINRSTADDEVYISEPGQLFKMNSKDFLKYCKMQE